MDQQIKDLNELVRQQLDLESEVADALEQLNDEMATLLEQAGIYGPTKTDLDGLSPLLETLDRRYTDSRNCRKTLARWSAGPVNESPAVDKDPPPLKTLIRALPTVESRQLDARREQIKQRMQHAQEKLTANQVVIFYSTEFHRRYLLGVLQCDADEANYQANGQTFKLPPEKIIGRNC